MRRSGSDAFTNCLTRRELVQGFFWAWLSRGDVNAAEWGGLKGSLPIDAANGRGHAPEQNCSILNGILWWLRRAPPRPDVPAKYGSWNTIFRPCGAHASRGGLPIIALPSMAGERSSIVSRLSGPVSTPCCDVGLVVTEHGIADLRGLGLSARRDALLSIAAPSQRGILEHDLRAN